MKLIFKEENKEQHWIQFQDLDTETNYIFSYNITECMQCQGDNHCSYTIIDCNNLEHKKILEKVEIQDFCFWKEHDLNAIIPDIENILSNS